MVVSDENTPLVRENASPRRTWAWTLAGVGALALAGVGVTRTDRTLGGVGLPRAALGESTGDKETMFTVVSSLQCAWACAEKSATVKKALTATDAAPPTCADARAMQSDDCIVRTCSCIEKSVFKTRVNGLCDGSPNDVFLDASAASAASECAQEYASASTVDEKVAGKELYTGDSLASLGVSQSPSSLGAADVWKPAHGNLLPLAPKENERAGTRAAVTFKLYTQCKTKNVKEMGGDFWFKPLTGAYIVRHNYGSKNFFPHPDEKVSDGSALRMQRAELEDGVYGYTLTTNQVDYEYGFILRNSEGDVFSEIGEVDKVPLSRERCARRFGKYFNRVITDEKSNAVEYVFGECSSTCDGFTDEAYCLAPFTGVVGNTLASAVSLGKIDDARLVNFASGVVYGSSTIIDPSGRAETFRYNDGAKDEQIWIIAIGDYFRDEVKMVQVKVVRDPATSEGKAYMTGQRKFKLKKNAGYDYQEWNTDYKGNGCAKQYCNVARYDIPKFWDQGTAMSGLSVQRMEFTKLALGDAPPTPVNYNIKYKGDGTDFLLTTGEQILAPGQWGEDMDVRRVIMKNAVLCGGSINYRNCMFGKAFPVDPSKLSATLKGAYSAPSKNEKQWIFVIIEDVYFKMIRISVTLTASKGVYARVVDAGYISHSRTGDVTTSDSMAYDVSSRYNSKSYMPVASRFDAEGYGVGGFKFDIAAEMSTSLRGVKC